MAVFKESKELAAIDAPWGRQIRLQEVVLEGGVRILRMRIREGTRFTDLELTAEKAVEIGDQVAAWGRGQLGEAGG